MSTATKCKCGHKSCTDWHINHVAAVQGVKFTEEQAKGIAYLLDYGMPMREIASRFNAMDIDYGDSYVKCPHCGEHTHETYTCRNCRKDPV